MSQDQRSTCMIPTPAHQAKLTEFGYAMVPAKPIHSVESLTEEMRDRGYRWKVDLGNITVSQVFDMVETRGFPDWTIVKLNRNMMFFTKDETSFMALTLSIV